MNLKFDTTQSIGYTSMAQKARVLTESWVKANAFCPACGHNTLSQFPNNNPVADFLCLGCNSEYELKSKRGLFTNRIVGGAYKSMIERINSNNNPHFFFLNYSLENFQVTNFMVIPKHYFVNDIIEMRTALNVTAKRAGWIGCNILLQNIPLTGKIYIVKDGLYQGINTVLESWSKTLFLANQKKESRGWTIEIIKIIECLPNKNFKLSDVYESEDYLKQKFPNNNFVKDKIRQQLQLLRDKSLIEFAGNGFYTKN